MKADWRALFATTACKRALPTLTVVCNGQQAGAEILIDDFDPEVQAQQTLRQKAADAERHAARMLQQKKV